MYTVTIPTHVETSPKKDAKNRSVSQQKVKTLLNTSQCVFTTVCALCVGLGSKQQNKQQMES